MAKISHNQLAMYAVDQLEKGTSVDVVAQKLSAYLLENRQSRDTAHVLRAIDAELSRRGSTQVHITSAHPVSEEVKQQIAKLLDVKQPIFSEQLDSRVIGGVRAEAGESVIDLTIKNKLQQFRTAITRSHA